MLFTPRYHSVDVHASSIEAILARLFPMWMALAMALVLMFGAVSPATAAQEQGQGPGRGLGPGQGQSQSAVDSGAAIDPRAAIVPQFADGAAPSALPKASLEEQLKSLLETITTVVRDRAVLAQKIKATPNPEEAKDLQQRLKGLEQHEGDMRHLFEELAAGGINSSSLESQDRPKFDWKQQAEDVVRPVLDSMKRLTERPRLMEELRRQRGSAEEQLALIDEALAKMKETRASLSQPEVLAAMDALQKEWSDQRDGTARRMQRATVQLERLEKNSDSVGMDIAVALRDFSRGRGLNLLLALTAFCLSWLALTGIAKLVSRFGRRGLEKPDRATRVIALGFHLTKFSVSVLAAAGVLNARGDWLMLGVLIIIGVGVIWGVRQSIGKHLKEIRILLNMSGVREGERVIYAGIPWEVTMIHLYSTLHNPALRGGRLRLPLERMHDLQSRPFDRDEPWFPSNEGDIVLLEGDVFAKVLMQTPENVVLDVMGSRVTMPIASYVGRNPRNLSRDGFAVAVTLGLDYEHQHAMLGQVVPMLRETLHREVARQPFDTHLKSLMVEYNEAAASALNVLIVAGFNGAAASEYFAIRRFLQRTALEACNRNGWNLPFDQLTVHAPRLEASLSASASASVSASMPEANSAPMPASIPA